MWHRALLLVVLSTSMGCSAIARKPSAPSVVADASLFAAGVLLAPLGDDDGPDAALDRKLAAAPLLAVTLVAGIVAMIVDPAEVRPPPAPPATAPLPAPLDVPPPRTVRRNTRR